MRSALRTLLAALAVAIVVPSEKAAALEVFGNITQPTPLDNGGLDVFWPTVGSAYGVLAQGFRFTGANQTLTAVRLGLNVDAATINPTDKIVISLYGSTTGTGGIQVPGTLIGQFNADSPSPAYSQDTDTVYTFNYAGTSGTEILTPNTNYWVVASFTPFVELDGPIYRWTYATPASGSPAENSPGALNGSTFSYVGTVGRTITRTLTPTPVSTVSDWINYSSTGGVNPIGDPIYSGLSIGVVVVPEPSTYALGLVSVLVLGAVARRKSRKTATV
jgi:hypothetical protein